jgi:hypothetical protein
MEINGQVAEYNLHICFFLEVRNCFFSKEALDDFGWGQQVRRLSTGRSDRQFSSSAAGGFSK